MSGCPVWYFDCFNIKVATQMLLIMVTSKDMMFRTSLQVSLTNINWVRPRKCCARARKRQQSVLHVLNPVGRHCPRWDGPFAEKDITVHSTGTILLWSGVSATGWLIGGCLAQGRWDDACDDASDDACDDAWDRCLRSTIETDDWDRWLRSLRSMTEIDDWDQWRSIINPLTMTEIDACDQWLRSVTEINDWDQWRWLRSMTKIDACDQWLRSMTEINDWDQCPRSMIEINDWDHAMTEMTEIDDCMRSMTKIDACDQWLRSMTEVNDWGQWLRWLRSMTAIDDCMCDVTSGYDRWLWPIAVTGVHPHAQCFSTPLFNLMLEPLMRKWSFDAFNWVYKHEVSVLWRIVIYSMALLYWGVGTAWTHNTITKATIIAIIATIM